MTGCISVVSDNIIEPDVQIIKETNIHLAALVNIVH
jgi:hypothetical protein